MNLLRRNCEDGVVRRFTVPLVSAVVAVAAALAAAGCSGSSSRGSSDALMSNGDAAGSVDYNALHGAIPSVHYAKPSFQLTDTAGQPFDLVTQTHGVTTLLYFGYTHCPDECPTAMADVATALRKIGPAAASHVRVVFVTTDPWRDNRQVLRRWLDKFSPTFVGLSGTPAQVAGAEVQMGMPISRRKPAPKSYGSGRYAVDHMAAVIAYGRDDRVATLYPSGITPGEIAADLLVLIKG
jgi:protein SCO1/2